MPETSPPAPRLAASEPSSSWRNESGPRFDTTTAGRSTGARGYCSGRGPLRLPRRTPGTRGGWAATDATDLPSVRVVIVPDKMRGTATAREVAAAAGRAARAAEWDHDEVPVADGGEGTLDALGGANRSTTVTGPLGEPVAAEWRLDGRTAVVEMARASGLALVGGPEGNDPIGASTAGTGELVAAAIDAGARRVLVGLGGSATTDGGLGALRALYPLHRLAGVEIVALCDVRTAFVDAAEVFAPQKGASPAQVELLRRRLDRLADVYLADHGVDVRAIAGAGAAGGLAGGLAVAGATVVGGFEAVADELDLHDRMEGADLVITAEGFLDEQSFEGKVVGGVLEMAESVGVPVVAVVGEVVPDLGVDVGDRLSVVSLVERFGGGRARRDTLACVEEAVAEVLAPWNGRRPRGVDYDSAAVPEQGPEPT
ncbi:MAG TPA: glycerate kinase [Acidimicrobiales bacterium]